MTARGTGRGRPPLRGRVGAAMTGMIVALMGLLVPAGAAAQDAAPILQRAAALYAPVQTLCADFTQQRSVPLLGEEHTGEGRLCQARPGRFAMRFTQPDGDAVVVDGTSVWIYWPSLDPRQVMKLPVAQAAGGFDLHREFLSEPTTKYAATYEGADRVGGVAVHRIRLVPRNRASYRAAVVWIGADRPLLHRVRIEDENGSVRTVTLRNVRLGATPPAGWFTFTPPPGAQIIS